MSSRRKLTVLREGDTIVLVERGGGVEQRVACTIEELRKILRRSRERRQR